MHKTLALVAILGFATPAAANPIAKLFHWRAEKTGQRVFHPTGQAYEGTFTDHQGVTHEAEIRLSRGGANKVGRRDIMGVAVKAKLANGGVQDLTMIATAGAGRFSDRIPVMTNAAAGHEISSVSPYEYQGEKGVFMGRLPDSFHDTMDSKSTTPKGTGSFAIDFQPNAKDGVRPGAKPLGTVTVDFDKPRSSTDLAFRLDNNALAVVPTGALNKVRLVAMSASQAGRGIVNNIVSSLRSSK